MLSLSRLGLSRSPGPRLASLDSRSLQRESQASHASVGSYLTDQLVALTQRLPARTLGAASLGHWLLLPLSAATLDAAGAQVFANSLLWLLMIACLLLCVSSPCHGAVTRARRRPKFAQIWPGAFQELKISFMLVGLCTSLACVVCLARGGSFMLTLIRAGADEHCSVAMLGDLRRRHVRAFRCQDGKLDAEHEGTVLLRHGWNYDSAEVFRMAPVLGEAGPVAWAVAKDMPLTSDACRGLCGILLEPTLAEEEVLHTLAKELSENLGFSKQKDFELERLPLVALTDPSDPFGLKLMLFWAVFFYCLTLVALVFFVLDLLSESDYEPVETSPDTDTEYIIKISPAKV